MTFRKNVIVSFELFTFERLLRVLWANVTVLSQQMILEYVVHNKVNKNKKENSKEHLLSCL